MRTDVPLPVGSKNVTLQFLVDDDAGAFLNGTGLTSGFQAAQTGTCVSCSTVITLSVPNSLPAAAPEPR